MCHCGPDPCPPEVVMPMRDPDPVPDCEPGAGCEEVIDAACVVYTNEPLPAVGVETNDRLNDIIRKWALTVLGQTQAIATANTPSVILTGNGLASSPVKAVVKLDPDTHNLIAETNNGLLTKVNLCLIRDFVSLVTSDPEAHQLFCDLVAGCAAGYCGTATDLLVTYTQTVLRATWVPFTANSIGQIVQYKKLNDTQWTSLTTIGAFQATNDIPGVLPNTIYQVRVQTNCFIGGPSFNMPYVVSTFLCPNPTIVASYDNIAYSFNYLAHDYSKLTLTLQKAADNAVVGSKTYDLVAQPTIQLDGMFSGLDDSVTYHLIITLHIPLGAAYTKTCPPIPILTTSTPACNLPTGLSATVS